MDKNTIIQLNQLNQLFYQTVAKDFSQTRSQAWPGWQRLLPYLEQANPGRQPWSVLDIGCGNGRFAIFLAEQLQPTFHYWGIDNNQSLLNIAQTRLKSTSLDFQLIKLDLVDQLLTDQPWPVNPQSTPLLITLFGVMHHLPAQQLRIKLLKQLSDLDPNSRLIFTTWQFSSDPKLKQRLIDPHQVNLEPGQLEPHDYILDWRSKPTAYRYCHDFNQTEIDQLLANSNLELVATYQADGQSGLLNRYIVAKPRLRQRV